MQLSGYTDKMHTSLESGAAQYKLSFDDTELCINALVGKPIEITFNQQIRCSACGSMTKKATHRAIVGLAHMAQILLRDVTCAS